MHMCHEVKGTKAMVSKKQAKENSRKFIKWKAEVEIGSEKWKWKQELKMEA